MSSRDVCVQFLLNKRTARTSILSFWNNEELLKLRDPMPTVGANRVSSHKTYAIIFSQHFLELQIQSAVPVLVLVLTFRVCGSFILHQRCCSGGISAFYCKIFMKACHATYQ